MQAGQEAARRPHHPHQGDRTMRKQLRALIFAAGVALTTACGTTVATGGPGASVAIPAPAPATGVQQVSVTVGSAMQFAPSSLVVRAGLAAGALMQAALGAEFVFAGLTKVVAPNYTQQFRDFVQDSAGANSGPLSALVHTLVVPNIDVVAELARFTELIAGAVLLLSALEVARRRFAGPMGAQHGYEPIVALVSAAA